MMKENSNSSKVIVLTYKDFYSVLTSSKCFVHRPGREVVYRETICSC